MGNAGLSFYRIYSPKKFPANFLGAGPPLGRKPPVRYRHLSTFPVKPSEIPVNRLSPSKVYNPSTEPRKALKSPRFAGALLGHLHPTCAQLSPDLHPHLLQFRPKYPVFQHFLAHKKCFPRDFRDQFHDFARLSCIGKGLSKNMARILRGVKAPCPNRGRGVGWLVVSRVPCPSWQAVALYLVSPSPCGASLIMGLLAVLRAVLGLGGGYRLGVYSPRALIL